MIGTEIPAKCLRCGQEAVWDRDGTDPPDAVRAETSLCNRCDDGDFSETFYFDAAGRHITRDWSVSQTEENHND